MATRAQTETDTKALGRPPSRPPDRQSERRLSLRAYGATRAAVLRREALSRRALAAADAISAATAVVFGLTVLGDDEVTLSLLAALPLVVLVGKLIGLYDRDENLLCKTTLDEVPAIFEVATLYALLLLLLEGFFVQGGISHGELIVLWFLLFILMTLARSAARRLVRALVPMERCLVIGGPFAAKAIEMKLNMSPSVKARVVGRVSLNEYEINGAAPAVLGDHRELASVLVDHEIHRVVVSPDVSDSDEVLEIIRRVQLLGVRVSVLPRLFEAVGASGHPDTIDGLTLLGVPKCGLTKSSEIIKRGMDLVGSALGIVLLSPLVVVIAIAIKLDSPGPILFRQRRIGRSGTAFELVKFRTMVDGADALKPDLLEFNEAEDGLFKIAGDPRVTRVGRFLRRTCLDELPQLVNVLQGEMGLVGPRPLVPDEDSRIEGWERNRLVLRPGMTGHWQIFGSSRIPLREMVKIDYLYGANWSPWLDTKILLRTVSYAVRRRGL